MNEPAFSVKKAVFAAAFSCLMAMLPRGACAGSSRAHDGGISPDGIHQVGSMNRARAFAAATTLANGQVLVTGGIDANYNYLQTAELYDPSVQRFRSLPQMTTARASHTATLLASGQVLIAGGVVCRGGQCKNLSSAEVYDPTRRQFFPVGDMTTARRSHTATLLADGTVLVSGGSNGNGLSSAEIYDPVTERFAETGEMNTARFLHTASLLNDGEVLIAGGRSCAGECSASQAANSAEVYDPARRQFFPAGTLAEGRILHSATLLPDGRVLLSGGRSCVSDCEGDATLQDAEIYDPASGKFTSAGSMSDPRAAHSAVALPDGRVFVYGGESRGSGLLGGCQYLDRGELFEPASGTFIPAGSGTVSGEDLIAALLPSQQILVAGGEAAGSIIKTADVFSFGPN